METKFKDKILCCVECREEFVFTISAQEYFAQRGFSEDPKRCKSCYMELKRRRRREPEPASHDGNGNGHHDSPVQYMEDDFMAGKSEDSSTESQGS